MKLLKMFLVFAFCIILFSCQKEEIVIIENVSKQNLKSSNPLVQLLLRVTQNPTQFDNILDNTSCFEVKLPASVIVNGQNININTTTDFSLITDAQNNFPGDDVVNLIFPINIQYKNFEEQTVTNLTQFNQIKSNCGLKNDDFGELSCITFNFPISINLYNSNSQQANTLVFDNNINLYNFLNNLDSNDSFQFNFPISINNSDGQVFSINSNNALENFIKDEIDDCNEIPTGVINPNLVTTLTTGTWIVSYFFEEDDDDGGDDETAEYVNYRFVFNTDNSITVSNGSQTITGTWFTFLEDGFTKIEFTFDDSNLSKLVQVWQLIDLNSNNINLSESTLNIDDDKSYLNFRKL